jgi:hypothetical protein
MALTYYLRLTAADSVVAHLVANPRVVVNGSDGNTYRFTLASTQDRGVFKFTSLLAPEWIVMYVNRWMEHVQVALNEPIEYLVTKHIATGKIGTV